MTATLGDILLVFLADRPGSSHDLTQRYAQTFGPERAVDVLRVGQTLSRQERLGYVQIGNRRALSKLRLYALTEAGLRRQRAWIADLPAGSNAQDALDRVLLATAASDRATFDAVAAAALAVLESRRPQAGSRGLERVVSAQHARDELEAAMASSAIDWVRHLAARTRDRDAAA